MNELRRWSCLFSCAVLLLAAACGDDDDDDGAIALEELPVRVAEVYCESFLPCLGSLEELFLNGSECTDVFQAQFEDQELPRWQAAIAAGTLRYHADQVQDCLDAFADAGCDIGSSRTPAACEAALEGMLGLGSDCNATIECAGTAACVFDDQCPGTCSSLVAEGQVCDEDDQCVDGLTCEDGTCGALAGAGDPCEGPDAPACALGLLCLGEDDETSGTCRGIDDALGGGAGDPCEPIGGELCAAGLSCVLDSISKELEPVWLCAAGVGSGAACKAGFPDQCPAGEACDADPFQPAGDIDGTCVSLPDQGEPCAAVFVGTPCAPGLTCIEDVCTVIGRIGQPCTVDEGCYSDTCDGDTCTAPSDCAFEG